MNPGPTPGPAPQVSVVIPVHGDRGALRETLDCLAAQRTARAFEVLVVDNGDNGDLAGLLADRSARLLREPRRGSYAARNAGIAEATGSFLAFTDADCLPRPDWLEAGVRTLERSGPGSFVGGAVQMRPSSPGRLSTAEVWQVGHDLRQDRYLGQQGWAATASLFVRADDLARVGPFDAGLTSGGDKEWGQRATAAGLRGVYAADSIVDHPTRPTMEELLVKRRRVSRGSVDLARREGRPVHADGTLRALRPALRATWRQGAALPLTAVDRARLVGVTAGVHVYQRVLEARLQASDRRSSAARTVVPPPRVVPGTPVVAPASSSTPEPGGQAGPLATASPPPEVSVVVPTRNGERTLGVQLDALARQRTRFGYEVLVADNGSTDGTPTVVAAFSDQVPGLRLVDAGARAGSNVARNAGTQAARGTKVLLCDSDDEVAEDWLESLATGLDVAAGVGGTLELRRLNPRYAAAPDQPAAVPGVVTQLGFLPRPTGANAGFLRPVWEELGGFDETYVRGGAETEFFWRMQLAGHSLREVPEAVVHYRLRPDVRSSLRQMYIWGRQHAMLYRDFRTYGMAADLSDTARACVDLVRLAATIAWHRERRMDLGQRIAYRAGRAVGSYHYRVLFL